MSEIIIQEINNLTNKISSSPHEYSLQLINLYKNLENTRTLNQKEILCYLLILAINDSWKELSIELNRFQIKNNENKIVLLKLSKKFKSQPYADLHKEFSYFEKVEDNEVKTLALVLSMIYEQKQLQFLSKLYSSISIFNFQLFFISKYPRIQDLLDKYGIIVKDNFVLLNSSNLILNNKTNEKIDNLQFLNKNTTDIENIVRANPSTYYFPEQLA